MTYLQLDQLVDHLSQLGVRCRVGDLLSDVEPAKRPYFERWLSNENGFIRILNGNLDYIGVEDVVRMGPFFNIYCLIKNDFIVDEDENAHRLLDASPYYKLHNGKVAKLGWSGGVIASMLAKDQTLSDEFAKNIMREEVKKISIRAANFACVIETRTWDPAGLASIFKVLDCIAINVKELLKRIHLGEDVSK